MPTVVTLVLTCAAAVCAPGAHAWTLSRDSVGVRMAADPDSPEDAAALSEFVASKAEDIRRKHAKRTGNLPLPRGDQGVDSSSGVGVGGVVVGGGDGGGAGGAGSNNNDGALADNGVDGVDGGGSAPRRALQDELAVKKALLDFHNDKRGETAAGDTPGEPAATNMNRLLWDPALARVAQDYADGCVYEHNPNRVAEFQAIAPNQAQFDASGLSYVGENIAANVGVSGSFEDLALGLAGPGWFDEYQYYTYATTACEAGEQCGHYTQMVWATTRYVGCGWGRCPTLTFASDGSTWTNAFYLVCNYAEAGNDGGQPYVQTSSGNGVCSACDGDRQECTESMCDGCPNPDVYSSSCHDKYSNCAELCSSYYSDCGASCNDACSGAGLAAGAPTCCGDNLGRELAGSDCEDGLPESTTTSAALGEGTTEFVDAAALTAADWVALVTASAATAAALVQ